MSRTSCSRGTSSGRTKGLFPPCKGRGTIRRMVVEGCPPIESGTPLRQGYALPPPLPGEESYSINGRSESAPSRDIRSCSDDKGGTAGNRAGIHSRHHTHPSAAGEGAVRGAVGAAVCFRRGRDGRGGDRAPDQIFGAARGFVFGCILLWLGWRARAGGAAGGHGLGLGDAGAAADADRVRDLCGDGAGASLALRQFHLSRRTGGAAAGRRAGGAGGVHWHPLAARASDRFRAALETCPSRSAGRVSLPARLAGGDGGRGTALWPVR